MGKLAFSEDATPGGSEGAGRQRGEDGGAACGAEGGVEAAGCRGRAPPGPSAPRTQRRSDASPTPAPATCDVDPVSRHPRTTAVYMDNSCLLDLLIRCFAMTEPEDLNFTAFTDLCRLCSLKSGPRLHIFDKESEQRQILFKLRTCLPTMVSKLFVLPHTLTTCVLDNPVTCNIVGNVIITY